MSEKLYFRKSKSNRKFVNYSHLPVAFVICVDQPLIKDISHFFEEIPVILVGTFHKTG
jgi:hypothetical protein